MRINDIDTPNQCEHAISLVFYLSVFGGIK